MAPNPSVDPYALVGTTVRERYSVDRFVGVGRFSAVYRGTELETKLPVALRLLKVRATLPPSQRTIVLERLRGLVRPMSEVAQQCATFADTIEVGALITAQGRWMPAIAQAWLEGDTLESRLSTERAHGNAPRPLNRAMDMLAPVADALGYAHARGVVHGSLAPRNLFLRSDGLMQVLDLGLAPALEAIQRRDRAFSDPGTPVLCFAPSHGAPEQFDLATADRTATQGPRKLGEVGPASDVFALALVLTELVTGVLPLGEGDDAQLEAAAIDPARRPTPGTHGRDLGDHVEGVFERALAVRPGERYATVASFWDALRAAARVMSRASYPPPLSRISVPPERESPIPLSTRRAPSQPPPPPPSSAKELRPSRTVPRPSAPPPRRTIPPPLPAAEIARVAVEQHRARALRLAHEDEQMRDRMPSVHDLPTPVGVIPAAASLDSTSRLAPLSAVEGPLTPPTPAPAYLLQPGAEPPHREPSPPAVARTAPPPPLDIPRPAPLPREPLASESSESRISLATTIGPSALPAPRWLAILVAAAVGAVGAVVVEQGLAMRLRVGSAATNVATKSIVAAPAATMTAAAPSPAATCPRGMVPVHGGPFFMGSDDDSPAERPAHAVTLSPFCIDVTEVTVADYKACSDRGECKRAATTNDWPGITARDKKAFDPQCNARDASGRARHPANCVDWSMASAYCTAHGERLPTEAEWELAARGQDGRRFPWGDEEPDSSRLNSCGKECVAWGRKNGVAETAMINADDGFATTAPVGSFPKGASPFGVEDIVGNVWEWTSDWYASYPTDAAPAHDPLGPSSGKERAVRGGAWNGGFTDWVRPSFRWRGTPATKSYAIGFRCAKSL